MTAAETNAYISSLIRQSIEKLEMNYVRAHERGDVDPVVLLLDPRDAAALKLLMEHERFESVSSMLSSRSDTDIMPLIFSGMPLREALRLTSRLYPDMLEEFEPMEPAVGFRVFVVAAGDVVIATLPPVQL